MFPRWAGIQNPLALVLMWVGLALYYVAGPVALYHVMKRKQDQEKKTAISKCSWILINELQQRGLIEPRQQNVIE
jgi:hypothetical protein